MAKPTDRITIYLPEGERDDWQQLVEILDRSGVDVRDEKRPGNLSTAKMLRYLVQQERKRRQLPTPQ